MSKIIGSGIYVPGRPISNQELKDLAQITFDETKIENKLGIKTRYSAKLSQLEESTADFATKAVMNAIAQAKIDPLEIDLIIVATDTPEYISPSTATIVQGRIQEGARYCCSFDLNASCASFSQAYNVAVSMLEQNDHIKKAAVIGVYNMPAYVRPKDVFGLTIFADGAGAVILEKSPKDDIHYLSSVQLTDGTQWDYIGVYTGGTKKPMTQERLDKNEYGLELLKHLPGDRNVKLWPVIMDELLKKCSLPLSEVNHFLFTQINRSVIEQVMNILGRPMSDTTCIMGQYGYTGSACLPMAFHQAVIEKKIRRNDKVAMIASGAGLCVGANLIKY